MISVWGHLLEPGGRIKPDVLEHMAKYDSIFPLFHSLYRLGREKQWAYMVGPDQGSYLRLTPYVDMAGEFDKLYPGHNQVDFWDFFFPGIVDAWKRRPGDFRLREGEVPGTTFTQPYEDAAGSGIIISLFQPL